MKTVTYEQIKHLSAELAGRTRDNLPTSEATMLLTFHAAELPDIWTREAWPELCDHIFEATLDADKCFSTTYIDSTSLTVSGAGTAAVNQVYTLSGSNYNSADGLYQIAPSGDAGYELIDSSGGENNGDVLYSSPDNLTSGWIVRGGGAAAPVVAYTNTYDIGDVLAIITGGDPRLTTVVTPLKQENWTVLNDRVNVNTPLSTVWVDYQTPAPDLLDSDDVGSDVNTYELPARFKLPLAFRGAALLLSDEDPVRAAQYRGLAEGELQKQAARLTRPWWRQK